MRMPVNCPACGEPLLNKFVDTRISAEPTLQKTCDRKMNHHFGFFSGSGGELDYDSAIIIYLTLPGEFSAKWNLINHELKINNLRNEEELSLPYFEPDFSNYKKLVSKLKTYLTFS